MENTFNTITWLPEGTQLVAREENTGKIKRFLVVPQNRSADPSISFWPATDPPAVRGKTYTVIKIKLPKTNEYLVIGKGVDVDELLCFGKPQKNCENLSDTARATLRAAVRKLGKPVHPYLASCLLDADLSPESIAIHVSAIESDFYDAKSLSSQNSWTSNCCKKLTPKKSAELAPPEKYLQLICLKQKYDSDKTINQKLAAKIASIYRDFQMPECAVEFAIKEESQINDPEARDMLLVSWAAALADMYKTQENSDIQLLQDAKSLLEEVFSHSPDGLPKTQHPYRAMIRIAVLMRDNALKDYYQLQAERAGFALTLKEKSKEDTTPLGPKTRKALQLLLA